MNQNAVALILTLLAGSATVIGGLIALTLRNSIKPVPFAGALGFAGGVMTFVSFVEIYIEGYEHLLSGMQSRHSGKYEEARLETICSAIGMAIFFGGWLIASIMDGGLHLLMSAAPAQSKKVDKKDTLTPTTEKSMIAVQRRGVEQLQQQLQLQQHYQLPSSSSSQHHRNQSADGGELLYAQSVHKSVDENNSPLLVDISNNSNNTVGGCFQRFYTSKWFRALLGTEEQEKGARIMAEKQFLQDCHKITRLGYFTAFVLALHNIPEGIATFTGGSADVKLGVGLAIAIGIHNIPEGLAVAVPILFGTGSHWKALIYTAVSGLAEPLGGILAWLIIGDSPDDLIFGILFYLTAGIMVNVAFKELVFAAIRYDSCNQITSLAFFGGMVIMALSIIALDLSSS